MSWGIDEDWAAGHEGWAAARLPGGEFSGGSMGVGPTGGWLVDGDGAFGPDGEQRVVPYSASDGWTARCACGWVGPSIDRAVTRPGEYGDDPDDAYLPDGRSVEEVLCEAWETTHMAPAGGLAVIRAAAVEANRARARLDAAVREARASSRPPSWAEIGKAAGISRQSAHERWGRETPAGA